MAAMKLVGMSGPAPGSPSLKQKSDGDAGNQTRNAIRLFGNSDGHKISIKVSKES